MEVLVIFVEDEWRPMSDRRLQLCQLLVAWYPADLEESTMASPEDVTIIDVLTSDRKGEAD